MPLPGPGQGAAPSLHQPLVSLSPRKDGSKDKKGNEQLPAGRGPPAQCCFSAPFRKKPGSKGCPSFQQQGLLGGGGGAGAAVLRSTGRHQREYRERGRRRLLTKNIGCFSAKRHWEWKKDQHGIGINKNWLFSFHFFGLLNVKYLLIYFEDFYCFNINGFRCTA